jgi:tripartite-type tricarboxylate transporter receptor subunit TctC
MRLISNPLRLTISLLLALTFQSSSVLADETWPTTQTLKIVVPYAAGSNGDAVGRVVASYLIAALKGSAIVVENRPGIGGILGTRPYASAPAVPLLSRQSSKSCTTRWSISCPLAGSIPALWC